MEEIGGFAFRVALGIVAQGVPLVDEALDLVFATMPEEELIDRAIAKRIRLRGKPRTRLEAKKLFDHLLRQGFNYELVSDKVRALSKLDADETGQ